MFINQTQALSAERFDLNANVNLVRFASLKYKNARNELKTSWSTFTYE